MNQDLYLACQKKSAGIDIRTWNQLAEQWNISNGKILKDRFLRAQKTNNYGESTKTLLDVFTDKTINIVPKKLPKILIFDIETSPVSALLWPPLNRETRVPIDNLLTDWHLFSWAGKWLFQNETFGEVIDSQKIKYARANGDKYTDDKSVVMSLYEKFNEADIVVGYNTNSFDIKKMNTRFAFYEKNPPLPYKSIDLYETVKNKFSATSSKLDFINEFLGLDVKLGTGMALWKNAWYGDKKSLQEMYTYNLNDTAITEELYLRLQSWISNHPNINLFYDEEKHTCRNCGKEIKLIEDKFHYTPTGKYNLYSCGGCGATLRGRKNILSKTKRETIYI